MAEEFTKLYYDTTDKRRHVGISYISLISNIFNFQTISQLMSRLYLDSGLLSWNGNGIRGHEQIQKFIIDLPISDHSLVTLDAQPILGT